CNAGAMPLKGGGGYSKVSRSIVWRTINISPKRTENEMRYEDDAKGRRRACRWDCGCLCNVSRRTRTARCGKPISVFVDLSADDGFHDEGYAVVPYGPWN